MFFGKHPKEKHSEGEMTLGHNTSVNTKCEGFSKFTGDGVWHRCTVPDDGQIANCWFCCGDIGRFGDAVKIKFNVCDLDR